LLTIFGDVRDMLHLPALADFFFPGAPFWLLLVPTFMAWRYANSRTDLSD
jgi:hypothetical protein